MRAINYPFQITPSGKIVATSDTSKIYQDRLLSLISTVVGQRVMRPTYGTDLGRGVYENAGDMVAGLEAAIREAVSRWLPEVSINEYVTLPPNSDGLSLVDIVATFPGGQPSTTQIYMTPEGKIQYVRN